MIKKQNEIEPIDSNNVAAWWRQKLETRTTVLPKIPPLPTTPKKIVISA